MFYRAHIIAHDDEFILVQSIRERNAQLERPYCRRHWNRSGFFGATRPESTFYVISFNF